MTTDYISIDSVSYRVYDIRTVERMEEGAAYILSKLNPYVFPYRGTILSMNMATVVGIYTIKNKKGNYVVRPDNSEDKHKFDVRRVTTLTVESIFQKLESNIPMMGHIDKCGECDVFAPPIKEDDDISLMGMKKCFELKAEGFNNRAHLFQGTGTKNNARKMLTTGKTLKLDMSLRIGEPFGIGTGVIYWDLPGETCPIDKSDDNIQRIYYVGNNDIDLSKKNIEFVRLER